METNVSAYIIFVPPSFSKFIITEKTTIVKDYLKVFFKKKVALFKESPCNDIRCMV